jgi:photosystem II stability/assembly factor-like uncharacterized protein
MTGERDKMITQHQNHKSIYLAIFCVLTAGLIALTSCASLAVSVVFQKAGESLATGCGSVTMLGSGGGGSIRAIAIVPSHPGILYAGSDVGGIYKSTNDGESWVIKNQGLTNYFTESIAVNPIDPQVIYTGGLGGVFKSTDGGETWVSKRNGFPELEKWYLSAPVSVLAIDPLNSDIVYAGIGHKKYSGNSYEETHGQGTIYKSVDGGDYWFIVNTGPSTIDPSAVIHSIAIDPIDTNILYTGTDRGLYKSTDGGVSWTAKNGGLPAYPGQATPNAYTVIVNPHNTDILYVTVQSKPGTEPWQGGVYRSTDGGESWQAKCNGLASYVGGPNAYPMQTANYREIVIDPVNPETLYVGQYTWGESGIYKTTDGGDNWIHSTIKTGPGQNMDLGWLSISGLCVTALAMDPSDPSRLYFGTGMIILKTDDGGGSWSQVYTKETTSGKSTSIGLETTCVWDIAVDKTNPDNIYVGYYDICFLKSTDGGASFKRTEMVIPWVGNTFSIAIDPDSPNIIYAGIGRVADINSGWVVKSKDYGESFTVIGSPDTGLPDAMVHSIVIDPTTPVNSRTLYAASFDHGVYKSVDGGQSWVSINNGIGANRYVYRLVMDPNNPDILYVGIRATPGQSVHNYGGIYRTKNGGESWIKANENIELPNVYALVIDPSDSNTLFAGTGRHYTQSSNTSHLGGVYKSVDKGENWEAVLTDDPPLSVFNIGSLAISPVNPDIVFAGVYDAPYHDMCGGGIFISTDGGNRWKTVNEDLAHLNILAIAPHPTNPDIVYAGTGGNSILRINLAQPASLSDLTISPPEVNIGETVTISVLVTNPGSIECTYQVQLMLDGSVEETKEVTLIGGDSQTVTFTITKDFPGVYSVTIGALSGVFTVKISPEPLLNGGLDEGPPFAPTPGNDWPVLRGIIIIGGVIFVLIFIPLVYFLLRRKKSK